MPLNRKRKNVAVIGGGTGTSVVLEGLKNYPLNLSAIITTADNGSSSGILRDKFNMIPPGDIRQCLISLATGNYGYLNERFQKGFLQGHTLGNLLITLFYQKNRNFQEAIDELLFVTGAQGSIIPMTLRPVTLVANLKNGKKIIGEKNITPSRSISGNLKSLSLLPKIPRANPRAVSAIKNADAIIVGPGNLYCSLMPHFLVSEIRTAFKESKAKKIYVANLLTQKGHTDNFSLSDYLGVFKKYAGADLFSSVVYNSTPIAENILAKNKNVFISKQVIVPDLLKNQKRFIGKQFFKNGAKKIAVSDPIAKHRNPFLHDSHQLAKALLPLL